MIARVASDLLWAYQWILIARLLLSWFPHPPDGLRPVYRFLYTVTEPVLRLVRPLIPPVGGMDFSPLLIFAVIYILQIVLSKYA
ncbi:MAG: YggT family protein [Actinomycetota bacterium]